MNNPPPFFDDEMLLHLVESMKYDEGVREHFGHYPTWEEAEGMAVGYLFAGLATDEDGDPECPAITEYVGRILSAHVHMLNQLRAVN